MSEITILVIDDEKLIVKATSLVLRLAGYQVLGAYDGSEGLEAASEHKPDLILLDIMMPGMDGWQVLKCLKEDPELAHIPVVIFTAKEYIRGKEMSITAGAADYISKPFEPDDLVRVINEVCERKNTLSDS